MRPNTSFIVLRFTLLITTSKRHHVTTTVNSTRLKLRLEAKEPHWKFDWRDQLDFQALIIHDKI